MVRRSLQRNFLGEARELNEFLAAFKGQGPGEILSHRLRAAASIVEALLKAGPPAEALSFLERQAQGPDPGENRLARAWLSLPVVASYMAAGLRLEALSLFRGLARLLAESDLPEGESRPAPQAERLTVALGWVAAEILEGLARKGLHAEAKAFYAELGSLGPTRAAQDARALAASLLIASLAEAGLVNEAQEVYLTIPDEEGSEAVAEAKRASLRILPKKMEIVGFEAPKRFDVGRNSRQDLLWRFKVNRWWDWARFMVKNRG
jgi:hypothetical protein